MTTPTINTYTDRLRAIMAAYSGIGTDVSDGADLTVTPGFEVYIQGGRHEREGSSRRRQVSRTLVIRVYHTLIDDTDNEVAVHAAFTAARAVVEVYVDWLYRHDGLRLNAGDTGVTTPDAGIASMGDIADSVGFMPYNKRVYVGFDLEVPISYNRG